MKREVVALGVVVFLASAGDPAWAQEEVTYRAAIATAQTDGLHALELTEAVYRASRYADLRDLRIVNSAGTALPLAALPPAPRATAHTGASSELRLVTLPGQPQQRERTLQDFALRVEKEGERAVIEINPVNVPSAPGKADDAIGGYLADLRAHRDRRGDLVLEFAADAPDFAAPVSILGSEDFVQWQPLASGALVRNRQFGDTIERVTFPLSRVPSFIRVAWDGAPPRLNGARFVERTAAAAPLLPRATLAVARGETANSYYVDVPIALPIVRLHIRISQPNVLALVRVYRYLDQGEQAGRLPANSRLRDRIHLRSGRQPERWVPEGPPRPVFNLSRDGKPAEGEPLMLSARTTQLRIEAVEGTSLGDALPVVEAEWQPVRYAFLARTPGPYALAISAATNPAPGPQLDTRAVLPADDAPGTRLPLARLTEQALSGGESGRDRAERIARAAAWSRYLLWGVLLLAVLALAVMAWRIATQLRGAPAGGASEGGGESKV